MEGEVHYLVKDPIRAQFFRFNELQVAMMELLDGARTDEAIAQALAARFDVEVTAPAVSKFRDQLQQRWLLDCSAYPACEPARARQVHRRMRRRGSLAGQLAPVRDLLERGEPCEAARQLRARLAADPADGAARDAMAGLHRAFFEAHRETPGGVAMLPLWNPDRTLSVLDRWAGRALLGPEGAALAGVLLLAAGWSLAHADFSSLSSIRLQHVLLAALLTIPFRVAHELSHGLVCKHYGGSVPEMGLLLISGVIPGAYCDVSDTYLFERRRQKVLVQLAGGVAELMLVCVCLISFSFVSHPGWANALLIAAGWRTWGVVYGWVPLVKLDGYYALADALDLPNLHQRSTRYVQQALAHVLLGAPPATPDRLSPRERRVFAFYGTAAGVFSVAYLYGPWLWFLLPLIARHVPGGPVLALLFVGRAMVWPLGQAAWSLARLAHRHRRELLQPRRLLGWVAGVAALVALASSSLARRLVADPLIHLVSSALHG